MTDSSDKNEQSNQEKKASSELTAKRFVEGSLIADRFRVLEQLGGGGMGLVFKARDQVLNRVVAVKVLISAYTDQDILRFQQEAKASSGFSHPNLVTVLDFGLTGGNQPFLAMEYVSGNTLAQWIKNGKLDLLKSISILKQVCDGMSKAHELNVVHRDLKPSNILLVDTTDGTIQVKIIDFGIAKRTTEEQGLTTAGAGIGSPLYMSPEQVRGELVDNRTDIYSFGCVAFEMLTGRVPFRGKDAMATMTMHMTHELPSLSTFVEGCDRGKSGTAELAQMLETLYEIIARCLAKKSSRRYHTFADVKDALLEFEETIADKPLAELQEVSSLQRKPRYRAWIAAALILVGSVSLTLVLFKIDNSKRMNEKLQAQKREREANKANDAAGDWKSWFNDLDKEPTFGYTSYYGKEHTPSKNFTPEDMPTVRKEIDENNAQSLELSHCNIKGKELSALAGCNLRSIRLNANPLTPEAFIHLSKIPTLESIDLAKNNLSDGKVLYPLAKLPKLDTLILFKNQFDASVFLSVQKMSNLGTLTLSGCPLKGEVPENLGNLKKLRALFLPGTGCDDRLARVLPRLKYLKKLDISISSVSKVTLKSLSHLPLIQLSIARSKIRGEDLHLISDLPIEVLNVAGLGLTDDDCRELLKFKKLSRLEISGNKLTDTGFTRLASLPKITEIKCADNPSITARGIACVQALKKNIVLYTDRNEPFPMY